jgi:HAD superfamily hydrolase (TIGR01509 family)
VGINRFKALFWDNDGVLVDTEHLYFEANRAVFATVGYVLTAEKYLEFYLRQSTGAWHELAEQGITPEEAANLRLRRNAIYAKSLSAGGLVIAGVEAALRALKPHFRQAIVTSSDPEHFDMIHRSAGLLKYFDYWITPHDYSLSKPDPEPYLKAIARGGFEAADCLAIEDTERGVAAAKAAGITCWALPSRLTRSCKFASADRILSSLDEALALLEIPPAPTLQPTTLQQKTVQL